VAPSYEEVHRLAQELPEDQRIQLVNALLEGLDSPTEEASEAEVAAAWDEEIKRRLDEIDSGKVKMISHGEVMREMEDHLRQLRRTPGRKVKP